MQHRVIVSFGKGQEFDFCFSASEVVGRSAEEARIWMTREFEALNCHVSTPTGKILVVDRVLSVAKYAGVERFLTQRAWAEQFARFAAILLGRDLIRVDVANYVIGY